MMGEEEGGYDYTHSKKFRQIIQELEAKQRKKRLAMQGVKHVKDLKI